VITVYLAEPIVFLLFKGLYSLTYITSEIVSKDTHLPNEPFHVILSGLALIQLHQPKSGSMWDISATFINNEQNRCVFAHIVPRGLCTRCRTRRYVTCSNKTRFEYGGCPTTCPSPHARVSLCSNFNRNLVWHSQTSMEGMFP
jgi:hypothetical protein